MKKAMKKRLKAAGSAPAWCVYVAATKAHRKNGTMKQFRRQWSSGAAGEVRRIDPATGEVSPGTART